MKQVTVITSLAASVAPAPNQAVSRATTNHMLVTHKLTRNVPTSARYRRAEMHVIMTAG